jgi:Uma2 family endonuclease
MSVTVAISESTPFTIPSRASASLHSFRECSGNNDLPEKSRVDYYKGEVLVDMSKEQLFTHGLVKTEIARVIATLTKREKLGQHWCNGVLVSNEQADHSGNPDGTFISTASFENDRVELVEGAEGGFVEIVGTVDMVLEVVSDSSEKKDTETLFEAYYESGIAEYWLVDARGDDVEFHIYKRGSKKYTPAKKLTGGWMKSSVFGRAFRLMRLQDAIGNPEYPLEVK